MYRIKHMIAQVCTVFCIVYITKPISTLRCTVSCMLLNLSIVVKGGQNVGLYGFFYFNQKIVRIVRNVRIMSQIVRIFRIFSPENIIFFDFDLIKS